MSRAMKRSSGEFFGSGTMGKAAAWSWTAI